MDPSLVESAEQASDRLCREYSVTPPADLLLRVHGHLRLGGGTRLPHRTYARLLAATGWAYVVLANAHGDLGHHEAAQTSRNTAFHLGREIGDGNIAGWTFELASYFAMYDGLPQDALAAAEEGVRYSPANSAASIANILKIANAWARLGNRLEAERAIERAGDRVSALPVPEYPDHHYAGFDPPKVDLFASRTYAWLDMPSKAEFHARRVIRQCGDRMSDPKRLRWTPGRLSMARLDLASALVAQGELEEACALATEALQPILRRSIVARAGEVDASLLNRHRGSPDVMRFHDHYLEARRSLQTIQSGS